MEDRIVAIDTIPAAPGFYLVHQNYDWAGETIEEVQRSGAKNYCSCIVAWLIVRGESGAGEQKRVTVHTVPASTDQDGLEYEIGDYWLGSDRAVLRPDGIVETYDQQFANFEDYARGMIAAAKRRSAQVTPFPGR